MTCAIVLNLLKTKKMQRSSCIFYFFLIFYSFDVQTEIAEDQIVKCDCFLDNSQ